MLGQEKLLNKIDNLTLDSLPHSIILLGDIGSGKNMICDYMSKKFNLTLLDITNNLNQEYLDELMLRVEPYLYKIEASDVSIKDENTILKFIEEPLKNSYIVICCDNKAQLIQTVLNRCQIWQLEKYSREQLKTLSNNNLILDIAKTPGQVIKLNNIDINSIMELANKIFDMMDAASYPNALSLAEKIAFKDEQDKYDFNVFIDVLVYVCSKKIMQEIDNEKLKKLLFQYNLTNTLSNSRYIPHINKRQLFENYILRMKGVTC